MLKDKYDVIIVGSGPSGASCAMALKDKGLGVAIIEKAKLPRHKMCSGILFPAACKFVENHFGTIPHDIYCQPEKVNGSMVELTLDSDMEEASFSIFDADPSLPHDGENIDRAEFDLWLCRETDADIIDKCRFKSCLQHKEDMIVTVEEEGEAKEIKTKYLIGADGCLSRVRQSIAPDFNKKIGFLPQYEEFYTGEIELEAGPIYAFYDRKITGFFATVMLKDDKIILTTGARDKRPLKDYFSEFVRHIQDKYKLKIKETVARHGCVLHDMSVTDNFFMGIENVLLVGEAGGFNRYAEGITSALITGRAAGEAILESIKSGEPPIKLYIEASADERKQCAKVAEIMSKVKGFNMFTRD